MSVQAATPARAARPPARLRHALRGWPVVALAVTAFAWMIPVIFMVSVAVRIPAHSFDPTLVSLPVTFGNFAQVIRDNPLLVNFMNSLVVTGATVVLVVLFGSLFAFACSILQARGGDFIYSILLITLMMPVASLVLPLAIMLKFLGLINTLPGLILPYTALGIPFTVVILKSFLDASPRELYEAAVLDGCGPWQLYRFVAMPLVRPTIVFVGVWQFITTWNEFFLALIVLTDTSHKTLTIVPMQYSGLYMANPGNLFAVLVLIALPLIVIYIAVQRYFVSGLLEGALKG